MSPAKTIVQRTLQSLTEQNLHPKQWGFGWFEACKIIHGIQ